MKKRFNLDQRTLTVDEIMLKIKEISEQKKKSLAPEDPFENIRKKFNFANPRPSENRFYTFATKIGKKLNRRGPYRFFKKVEKLIPQRLKYKTYFKDDDFIKYS